jgi:cation:H+ antiporter
MFTSGLFFVVGVVLLIKGANWLVEGGSSISRRFGVSDLVIGLTIVSFGTSAPELLVNIIASFKESADIAIGNVVGSNIANTLLILGAAALFAPLKVQKSTVFKEIPFCLLAAITLFVMANDAIVDGYAQSELSRSDGLAFLGFFIIFLYYTFGIRHNGKEKEKSSKAQRSVTLSSFMVISGCVALALGGKLVVDAAQSLAVAFNVSEALIGLTIVALGTSLPELVTSVMAALKGKTDIAIGNVVGSNIFNIFWILGLSAVIKPLPFAPAANFDLSLVVISTVLLFIFVHNGNIRHRLFLWWKQKDGHTLNKLEGIILLSLYVIYIGYIGWRG